MSLFSKLKDGLKKTRDSLGGRIEEVLVSFGKVDEELLEELEEALILSDVGAVSAVGICDDLRARIKKEKISSAEQVKKALREIILKKLGEASPLILNTKPSVVLMIGVNGAGKTTTCGKLASLLSLQGKSVLLCAADTFRAAAIEQLTVWAERSGVPIIKHAQGADPAAVVFDGISAAKARGCDVLLCDTAGRLHNKKNLMEELSKIRKVITREAPDAAVETLLVLDATTGQNALSQAKEFASAAQVTGIVLTKLDGTAKGGVVISVGNEMNLPVKLVGVGEGIEDLQPFDPEGFTEALFER